MRYKIENEYIAVEAITKGAEAKSMVMKETGQEYLWPGDEENWGRSTPLLFPIVGRMHEKHFKHKGQKYFLKYHGFARESVYDVQTIESNKIVFTLTDTPERLEVYPFKFLLEVIYELPQGEKCLKVTWRVHNKSDEEMYFSIGGHPGFLFPNGDMDGCKIAYLDRDGAVLEHLQSIVSLVINADGLLAGETVDIPMTNGIMPAVENTEKYDTILVNDKEIGGLGLCDRDGNIVAKVLSDAPYWGIWREHTPGSQFLCYEPWFGVCGEVGFCGEIKDKLAIERIPVGGCWENGFKIEL